MLGVSIDSLLLVWAIIEINILFFIPLIIFISEWRYRGISGIKYFFIQSLASILLLIIILFLNIFKLNNNHLELFLLCSILWKMGAPPFHLWLLNIIVDLEWIIFFILSSLQKILPFFILRKMRLTYIDFFIIFSLGVRLILRFWQSRIKKILIISSIFVGAWILASVIFLKRFWLIILLVYSFILFMCVNIFVKNKLSHKNRILISSITFLEKISVFILLIAMAGIPPLAGFYLKLVVMWGIIRLGNILISSFILFSSVILIYIYRGVFLLSLRNQRFFSFNIHSTKRFNFFNYMGWLLAAPPLFLLVMI